MEVLWDANFKTPLFSSLPASYDMKTITALLCLHVYNWNENLNVTSPAPQQVQKPHKVVETKLYEHLIIQNYII